MIFYFSGTGNSYQVAKQLAVSCDDRLISIADAVYGGAGNAEADSHTVENDYIYELKDGERIGFVFPVYAWGPPPVVGHFVSGLKLQNYKSNYTYAVTTCGDNIGRTMGFLEGHLKRKGMNLDSAYSVRMPNNYVIMFDVDSEEEVKAKFAEAEIRLKEIAETIKNRKKGEFKLHKGLFDSALSIINPMFSKHALDTKPFRVDDSCTGCGICQRICNTRTIKVDGRPSWGKECTQCLACLHICPVNAIQYGKGTVRKGRYMNPEMKKDLNKLLR
jgi:NAD-dependent dihydropyrimidine dehydrogenase PreA subunit/flavodoxin